jgi:D-alanyl-D-alanine carboxypeptidase/D-alanyl-D-alanine-endopeptidase (penicillin-binding protein 4)
MAYFSAMYNYMKILFLSLVLCAFHGTASAQTVAQKLAEAFRDFEADPQMKSGIASLYVIDAATGKVVFEKNGLTGLAPASTQKIITSATAYMALGKDFRYRTELAVDGPVEGGKLKGSIYILPSGDPTLGSWRWNETKEAAVLRRMKESIRKAGINQYSTLVVDEEGWNYEIIPDGWIWQDIGNYYGAGAGALNWRENQYDLILRSGNNLGDPVTVAGTQPKLYNYNIVSHATSAAKGSGDNAYIYFPQNSGTGVVRGTIPVEESRFVISGAMPSSRDQLVLTLADSLSKSGIRSTAPTGLVKPQINKSRMKIIHTEQSPPLDSIVYWFNRRSINLYGEALLKTIAFQKTKKADADKGVDIVQDTWKERGIAPTELNMVDGSGLSPLNRVTTHAQATILLHARNTPWFSGFYLSLPEYNGMKMKSGTIRGAKGYTGYHRSASGTEYVFSFLVNNYNGTASGIVQKMYRVLDVLK